MSRVDDVIEYLRKNGPATPTTIAHSLGLANSSNIAYAIEKLLAQGKLRRHQGGIYELIHDKN